MKRRSFIKALVGAAGVGSAGVSLLPAAIPGKAIIWTRRKSAHLGVIEDDLRGFNKILQERFAQSLFYGTPN